MNVITTTQNKEIKTCFDKNPSMDNLKEFFNHQGIRKLWTDYYLKSKSFEDFK